MISAIGFLVVFATLMWSVKRNEKKRLAFTALPADERQAITQAAKQKQSDREEFVTMLGLWGLLVGIVGLTILVLVLVLVYMIAPTLVGAPAYMIPLTAFFFVMAVSSGWRCARR